MFYPCAAHIIIFILSACDVHEGNEHKMANEMKIKNSTHKYIHNILYIHSNIFTLGRIDVKKYLAMNPCVSLRLEISITMIPWLLLVQKSICIFFVTIDLAQG